MSVSVHVLRWEQSSPSKVAVPFGKITDEKHPLDLATSWRSLVTLTKQIVDGVGGWTLIRVGGRGKAFVGGLECRKREENTGNAR